MVEYLQPLCFAWDAAKLFCFSSGNRDYSPYLSLLSAVKFWKAFGLERAWSYIDQTIANGVKILVGEWGTETLLSDSLKCRSMTLVRLPKEFLECSFGSSPAGRIQVSAFSNSLVGGPLFVQSYLLYANCCEILKSWLIPTKLIVH